MVKLNRDGSLIGNPGRSFARVKGVRLKAFIRNFNILTTITVETWALRDGMLFLARSVDISNLFVEFST